MSYGSYHELLFHVFMTEGVHILHNDCVWCVDYKTDVSYHRDDPESKFTSQILKICFMAQFEKFSFVKGQGQIYLKIVSEYDHEIPQSQTADKPMAPWDEPHNNHETSGRQTNQSNQLSLLHQDDCKTRMDIKT